MEGRVDNGPVLVGGTLYQMGRLDYLADVPDDELYEHIQTFAECMFATDNEAYRRTYQGLIVGYAHEYGLRKAAQAERSKRGVLIEWPESRRIESNGSHSTG